MTSKGTLTHLQSVLGGQIVGLRPRIVLCALYLKKVSLLCSVLDVWYPRSFSAEYSAGGPPSSINFTKKSLIISSLKLN
jgi:hypothetical protein